MPLPPKKTLLAQHRAGASLSELARKHGVSRQRIHQVVGKAEFSPNVRGNAKLTEAKVRELRRLRGKGWSYARLEERYGVTKRALWMAVSGRTWADVDEPLPGKVRSVRPSSKLTPAKVRRARELRAEGWSYSRIGAEFGVTRVSAHSAVTGKTWGHVE